MTSTGSYSGGERRKKEKGGKTWGERGERMGGLEGIRTPDPPHCEHWGKITEEGKKK